MKILFIGDIVGKIGRRMIHDYLPDLVKKYDIDFVIANGENVTHGKGLIKHHYEELIDDDIDVITLGNHYDNKSEIRRYIDAADRLIRPLNLINDYPGEGSIVYDLDGISVRVTNVLGSAMMPEAVNNPYYSVIDLLSNAEEEANIHIIDFHAEATGEKYCFAHALDGRVTAVLGTHTHVQTRDYRVLPGGTAFISDVGMTGLYDGALGFDKDSVTRLIAFGEKSRFEIPDEGQGLLSAVVIDVDEISGLAKDIFPIYFIEK